jgi:hypothetical protein
MSCETMYDSTDRFVIPADACAVAGYGGAHNRYQSYSWFLHDFPSAKRVLILAFAEDDGPDGCQDVCLDVEPGNSGPDTVAGWIERQHARGVRRPIAYAARADMQKILAYCDQAGIARSGWRRWCAHPGTAPHICSAACGYKLSDIDATQYAWSPGGQKYDISELRPDFFEPTHELKEALPLPTAVGVNAQGDMHIFELDSHGTIWYTFQRAGATEWAGGKTGVRIAGLVPFAPCPSPTKWASIACGLSHDGNFHVVATTADGVGWYTYQLKGHIEWSGGVPDRQIAGLARLFPAPGSESY